MSGEEINIAIARAVGWKTEHLSERCDGVHIIKCGACGQVGHSNCYGNGRGPIQFLCADSPCCEAASPANYCGDLNAMAEAEKALAAKYAGHIETYGSWLKILTDAEVMVYQNYESDLDYADLVKVARATARQRAEAFLRTRNLWKE